MKHPFRFKHLPTVYKKTIMELTDVIDFIFADPLANHGTNL